MKEKVTIDAWVARDEDKQLRVHTCKPSLLGDMWWSDDCNFFEIDRDLYDNITFKNSPKKVKVTIELEEEK